MKYLARAIFYLAGLLLIAFGVAFSVNSNLGVSPTSCLPYTIHAVLTHHGFTALSLGNCVTLLYICYVGVQILVLRRDFKWINVLQVLVATVSGWFIDFAKWVLGDLVFPGYVGRLGMIVIAVVLIALGILCYLGAKVMPMPPEGMGLAITQKLGRFSYHQVKTVLDCSYVVLAIVLSLVGTGQLLGVREGTIISAVCVGPVMGVLGRWLNPWIERLCFGAPAQQEAADAKPAAEG